MAMINMIQKEALTELFQQKPFGHWRRGHGTLILHNVFILLLSPVYVWDMLFTCLSIVIITRDVSRF